MSKYTFVVEIDGGTYLSQIDAEDARRAVPLWCDSFQADAPIGNRSKRLSEAVRRNLSDAEPIPVSGIANTWCFSAMFARKLVLGHVVLTVSG